MTKSFRAVLLLTLFTALLAGCREPLITQPPETPSETFVVTEISGTLTSWSAGEASVILAGGFESSFGSDTEELELIPPLYESDVSAAGTFRVKLSEPDAASFFRLGCAANAPEVAGIGIAIAATVAAPTSNDEIIGIYGLSDSQGFENQVVWLYVKETYEAKTSCAADSLLGLSAIDLSLAPGWNQVVASFTEEGTSAVLTSAAVPDTFVWTALF